MRNILDDFDNYDDYDTYDYEYDVLDGLDEFGEFDEEDLDSSWEEFVAWARENPSESDYPLREDYVTNRAYKKALAQWEEKARAAMFFS